MAIYTRLHQLDNRFVVDFFVVDCFEFDNVVYCNYAIVADKLMELLLKLVA